MTAVEHPMQPVYRDSDGVIRFKQNKIVRFLVERADAMVEEIPE
jgi:hypothetical protein